MDKKVKDVMELPEPGTRALRKLLPTTRAGREIFRCWVPQVPSARGLEVYFEEEFKNKYEEKAKKLEEDNR